MNAKKHGGWGRPKRPYENNPNKSSKRTKERATIVQHNKKNGSVIVRISRP